MSEKSYVRELCMLSSCLTFPAWWRPSGCLLEEEIGGNTNLLSGISLKRLLLPAEIFPRHGSLVSCRQRWHYSWAAVHTAERLKSQRDS